ncbi:MAG: DNA repair protein RecO [Elusimicrobia bacterium RIFOXYA1_FULL_47_7]|nr:MAG: DNA repair protein RecO [Elusimicrobia bacterium RIFOXYA1_FULL_47_7]
MYHRLQALVLKTGVSAEADKTVLLFTREWVKVSAVVPGAKKIKAKLSAAAEPVLECDFSVYLKTPNARSRVTGVRILNGFSSLRSDWRRFCMAQHCSEICDALTMYNSENAMKYDLLGRTWELLEKAENPKRIVLAFTMRFLKLSGYSFLDYIKRGNLQTTRSVYDVLLKISTMSGEALDADEGMDDSILSEVESCLEGYLNLYLTRPLHSKKFMSKIAVMEKQLAAAN